MKYLEDLINLFGGLKKGITTHAALWANQIYTPDYIQGIIDALNSKNEEIKTAENTSSRLKKEGRQMETQYQAVADKIIKMAGGFHADTSEQLIDYDIKLPKTPVAKPRPEVQEAVALKDDTDGQGFIVSTNGDPVANNYEWEKGQSANAADLNTIPEMKFFKYTSKTSFVDDDVARGVRYFYRVRAVNTAGEGPWSEAVSRVQ